MEEEALAQALGDGGLALPLRRHHGYHRSSQIKAGWWESLVPAPGNGAKWQVGKLGWRHLMEESLPG